MDAMSSFPAALIYFVGAIMLLLQSPGAFPIVACMSMVYMLDVQTMDERASFEVPLSPSSSPSSSATEEGVEGEAEEEEEREAEAEGEGVSLPSIVLADVE